jgi:hypothetical protein
MEKYKILKIEEKGIWVAEGVVPDYPFHMLKFERNVSWFRFHDDTPSNEWREVSKQFPEHDWKTEVTQEEALSRARDLARCIDGGSFSRRQEIDKQTGGLKERDRLDSWDSLS